MNIADAMIIKTNSHSQTGKAKKVRDLLRCFDEGQDVVVVPHDVAEIFITIEDHELVVNLISSDDGYQPLEIDKVKYFDSVAECWEYARVIATEAGLSYDYIDADVWDLEDE
jgi:hypothetical protein